LDACCGAYTAVKMAGGQCVRLENSPEA